MKDNLTKISLIALLFLEGCAKVDVSPLDDFYCVQENVLDRANETIYWNSPCSESIQSLSIEDLLCCDLSEELAIEICILNNPNLQALYESLGIAKANLVQASTFKNPIFSFAYRFPIKNNLLALIDADLFQNFLEILLIPLKKTAAYEELEGAKALVTARVLQTIAETKIAFYNLLAAQELWSLKKQMLLASELSYEAAQHLLNAGNIPEIDVAIERLNYEQMKISVASAEMEVFDTREALNQTMGLYGLQIDWSTSSKLPPVPDQISLYEDAENLAIKKSLDLKIAYHDLLATAARFGIETTHLVLPQFDLGISSEREDGNWYIGPSFSLALPLFDWGKANSAKARSTIMQKWNHFNALAVEVRSKARAARLSFLHAGRKSRYSKEVVIPLAEKAAHLSLLQHNAMGYDVFRLLHMKQLELQKKQEYIEFLKEFWKHQIKLETLLQGRVIDLPPQAVLR